MTRSLGPPPALLPPEAAPLPAPPLSSEPNDLVALIEAQRGPFEQEPDLAAQALRLLTFGGRLPVPLAEASLTPYQRRLLATVGMRVRATPAGMAAGSSHALGMTAYGRVVLARVTDLEPHDLVFGGFDVPEGVETRMRREADDDPETAAEDRHAARWQEEAGPEGTRQALERVRTALDQTDPMLLYVGEWTYGTARSLGAAPPAPEQRATSAVRDLSHLPEPEGWDAGDRRLVAGLALLLAGGFRGEEFNGLQLGPAAVERYFDECARAWTSLAGADAATPYPATAMGKAAWLARRRAALAPHWVLHRNVNGLTLHKGVGLFPRCDVRPLSPRALPPRVEACIRRAGLDPEAAPSLAALTCDYVRAILAPGHAPGPGGLNGFEGLIRAAVESLVEETSSDFGMARGLRDLHAFVMALREDRCEEIMSWGTSHYFCAVVPGAQLRSGDRGPAVPVGRALKAISARMTFNGWHYVPGHFDPARKPPGRHQYVPPRLPDLAQWSDQRHTGHRAVRVRYSIRAPGPVTCLGKVFPGFHDVRLMRCAGEPYGLAELQRALAHLELLQHATQALLDHVAAGGPPLRVGAFTDAWYDAQVHA